MTSELTTTEGIAQSLLPYYMDGGKKARYLSYMIAGFSIMESVKLSKIHLKSVLRWRESDIKFKELEESTPELRQQLADHLIDIEFTRNFRLVLAKDFKILFKDATEVKLTEAEHDYLLAIRKFYTPQQLATVKQLAGGSGGGGDKFDFTKIVLERIEINVVREERHG